MRPAPGLLTRLCRARRGAAAVETALVLPLALVLLLGTVEIGRAAWTQSALNFAVQEAARCASVRPALCGTSTQIAAYAAGKVQGLGVTAADFTVTPALACGTQIDAHVAYSVIAHGVFPTAPTIRARACRA
jgi:Flp pilus assembly protein TadG